MTKKGYDLKNIGIILSIVVISRPDYKWKNFNIDILAPKNHSGMGS